MPEPLNTTTLQGAGNENDVPPPVKSSDTNEKKNDNDAHHASLMSRDLPIHDVTPAADTKEDSTSTGEPVDPEAAHSLHDDKKVDLDDEQHIASKDRVIKTGHDVSEYLLSMRDDGDTGFTFRSMFMGTIFCAFEATMDRLYSFKPTYAYVGGIFMVIITYFIGLAWHAALPTAKSLRARWGEAPSSRVKRWAISVAHFANPGPFSLKEHAIVNITSSSASAGTEVLHPFTVQKLIFNEEMSAGLVIMGTLSVALLGYGVTGLLRPVTVYPSAMVYWGNLPTVQLLQGLHWEKLANSKPMRWFWYAFAAMAVYEIFPSYIFTTLVAVSIPCLASMHAPRSQHQLLTNLFGGAQSNEGLGLFSLCFDWQYISSGQVASPLVQQANSWIGIMICYVAFIALYYGNAWNARELPFLSTRLLTQKGERYPIESVFERGILVPERLGEQGMPRLTATYTFAMLCSTIAIGAMLTHVIVFWRKEAMSAIREAWTRRYDDRHQRAMFSNYKEISWIYYAVLFLFAFILGLVVNAVEETTLSIRQYFVALAVGLFVAPFSTMLFGRFGSGIGTAPLMKMIAGAIAPGRPLANLYFTAWSHSVVSQSLNLASDLKMGTYLKIPPFVMFFTQIWGTILGAFLNYIVMNSVVNSQRDVLLSQYGSKVWTGQGIQGLAAQASVWSLSKHLYGFGQPYFIVPMGLVIGVGFVSLHGLIVYLKPKIGSFKLRSLNVPIIAAYSGMLAYNSQSCIILTNVLVGVYAQYYLRNYKPRIFQEYAYIVSAGLDGGSLLVIFILTFAVFGAAGPQHPFPIWAGNPAGFADHCPDPSS